MAAEYKLYLISVALPYASSFGQTVSLINHNWTMCKIITYLEIKSEQITFNGVFRYNNIFFVVTYIIPMICMAFCYTKMGRHLWACQIIGEENSGQLKSYRNKKKVRSIQFCNLQG